MTMSIKNILYFDRVYDDFKDLLIEHAPKEFNLWFWDEMNDAERSDKIKQADYLLVAARKFGKDIISKAEKARFIQKTGIGVDNIDIEAANQFNLPVCNTPGANATGVAELTILLILALYRKLPYVNEATKNGKWLMWELRPSSYEMQGKMHGFIGFGNIGRETAKRSKAFGTDIIYYDKYRLSEEEEQKYGVKYASLEEVIRKSDIISLHVPLLPETKGLIGEKELNMMKRDAIIINVARGGVIDENALYHALKSDTIAGAGIDVWKNEPAETDHPLFTLENVIASPHIAAGTRDTLIRVLQGAFENIKRVDLGDPPRNIINEVKEARVLC
ncbi:3-phosphoglycerate dehydrogenase [bacterium LRH843]|nr:3-phosphoglycerate dehydrogenase [bacterium LRH843]